MQMTFIFNNSLADPRIWCPNTARWAAVDALQPAKSHRLETHLKQAMPCAQSDALPK